MVIFENNEKALAMRYEISSKLLLNKKICLCFRIDFSGGKF